MKQMFNLLSFFKNYSLQILNNRREEKGDHDIDEYIERVIEGIDSKLRFVPGYKKKLHKVVSRSLLHIDSLVDQIPGPLNVSRKTFVSDPGVRAYFATPDVLQETFNHGQELKSFFTEQAHSEMNECCALLCVNKEEKTVMGRELKGDVMRRDILQTAINFFDYKIIAPACNDIEVRKGIKLCIFDGLITYALQHIADIKIKRRDLKNEYRILHANLRARQAKGNGLSTMLAEASSAMEDSAKIKAQLAEAEDKLNNLLGKKDIFTFYLDEVRRIFADPESFIHLNVDCFRLTDMGIKVDDNASQPAYRVSFSELEIINVMRRVVTIIHYNKQDLILN